MRRRVYIGMDIGGRNIRAALCDESGEILARHSTKTDRQAASAEANVQLIAAEMETILKQSGFSREDVACAAIGVPGMTDTEQGVIKMAPNVPHWYDLPLRDRLQTYMPVPIFLDNDVNMGAVGEYWKGAARNCSSFFFLALGTGIGGGVFVNGKLYRGARYSAAEVGYMALEPSQKGLRVGDLGWLESIASGWGIEQSGRKAAIERPEGAIARLAGGAEQVTSRHVFQAARENDPRAIEILERATDYLALAIVNITAVLDPEMIVMGGGVAQQGTIILDPIREKSQGYGIDIPPIRPGELAEDSQIYGALYAALEYQEDYETA